MNSFLVRAVVMVAVAAASATATAALLPVAGPIATTLSSPADRDERAGQPVSGSPHWLADRLSAVRTQSMPAGASADAAATGGRLADDPVAGGMRVLAVSGLWADVRGTRSVTGAADLGGRGSPALWALVRMGQAQQRGDVFGALQGSLGVAQVIGPDVAPVPLPGALWFLLMGMLGWVGARITTTAKNAAPEPSASAPGRSGLPALPV